MEIEPIGLPAALTNTFRHVQTLSQGSTRFRDIVERICFVLL